MQNCDAELCEKIIMIKKKSSRRDGSLWVTEIALANVSSYRDITKVAASALGTP
jgi:hypothetical protein